MTLFRSEFFAANLAEGVSRNQYLFATAKWDPKMRIEDAQFGGAYTAKTIKTRYSR
jgi:hypothetical protein